MSRYKPYKKAIVYILKNNKRVFYGKRTIYSKDGTGKIFIRYKNRYYRVYHSGRNIYLSFI